MLFRSSQKKKQRESRLTEGKTWEHVLASGSGAFDASNGGWVAHAVAQCRTLSGGVISSIKSTLVLFLSSNRSALARLDSYSLSTFEYHSGNLSWSTYPKLRSRATPFSSHLHLLESNHSRENYQTRRDVHIQSQASSLSQRCSTNLTAPCSRSQLQSRILLSKLQSFGSCALLTHQHSITPSSFYSHVERRSSASCQDLTSTTSYPNAIPLGSASLEHAVMSSPLPQVKSSQRSLVASTVVADLSHG